MPTIQDTIYPVLIKRYSKHKLENYFTLSLEEREFINQHSKRVKPPVKVCFATIFKVYKYLGYFAPLQEVTKEMYTFIGNQLRTNISRKEIKKYNQSSSKIRHYTQIRGHLNVYSNSQYIEKVILQSTTKSAQKKNNIADIINDVIEELIKQYCELPVFSTIERTVRSIRNKTNNELIEVYIKIIQKSSKRGGLILP